MSIRLNPLSVLIGAWLILLPIVAGAESEESLHPARAMLEKKVANVLSILSENQDKLESPEYRRDIIEQEIVPYIDFETMTKLAVGKGWRKATPAQRATLVQEFRTLLINVYSDVLTSYQNYKFNFLKVRPGKRDDRVKVQMDVTSFGRDDVKVLYRLRKVKGNWKIYDISVSGVSLVSTYRSAFNEKIHKAGIDGLIKLLKQKNAS